MANEQEPIDQETEAQRQAREKREAEEGVKSSVLPDPAEQAKDQAEADELSDKDAERPA
jgi:hypothetical protein